MAFQTYNPITGHPHGEERKSTMVLLMFPFFLRYCKICSSLFGLAAMDISGGQEPYAACGVIICLNVPAAKEQQSLL
jgi:hypothetical protein